MPGVALTGGQDRLNDGVALRRGGLVGIAKLVYGADRQLMVTQPEVRGIKARPTG